MTRTYDRRTLLRTVGAVGIAATVAGCTGDGGDGGGTGGDGGSNSSPDSEDGGDGGSGGGSGEWTETSTVEMTDTLKYDPKRIQVSAGTTVTWENVGSIQHSVTAYEDEIPDDAAYFASGGFDSESAANEAYPDEGAIGGDESYEYTFETTGTYKYYCIPHEMNGMVGYVKVV